MNIAAKGSPLRLQELNEVISLAGLSFTRLESTKNIHSGKFDVIFDLNFDDDTSSIPDYELINGNCAIFLSSVKLQLEAHLPPFLREKSIGINALSTCLNRKALEYCSPAGNFDTTIIKKLGWENAFKTKSRVGLVSPRVICMIINEAYFTYEEGTANREDIDMGMKLGTAYPYGPFEWCSRIGIKDVYETLSALYNDTHDERYKICSSLKTEYLKAIK